MCPAIISKKGLNTLRTFSVSALAAVALIAVPGGCNGKQENDQQETMATSDGVPVLTRTVLMSGLDSPWDLAFTPDGAMLFSEKCRGLSVRRADGTVVRLFGTSGSAVMANDVFCRGQSGMNGVAVDPDFARNRFLYVFMASSLSRPETNRVVRLQVDKGYTTVSDRTDIVSDIPFKIQRTRWGGAGAHSGGRLRFSPVDGFLYVTTGDNHAGPLPQDLTRLGGKVLRIDGAGKAAPGNNVPSGGDPRIFTSGHRNIQGIAFRPGSGQPFSCEHGPGHSDEVTPLVAGGNGGWDPKPEPGVDCANNYCGYISNKPDGTPTPMTDLIKFPRAMRPSWNNSGESEGICPCVFLRGPEWQAWEGRLAVGFLRGRRIEIVQLDEAGVAIGAMVVAGLPSARIRTLVQGPDGALYVATDDGEIWRLAPQPLK
jgi:aldose sugar dehydrogenase